MKEFDLNVDGFCILRKVFSEEFLVPRRALLTAVANYADLGLEDPFDGYYLRHRSDQGVLYDIFQRHPEFQEMARSEMILEQLTAVLGGDIFLYENSVVYKPEGRENGVPYHQDFISRPNEPIKYIAWMAIDSVTEDGGALKVIPGTHKRGFLRWHRVQGETHHDRLDTSQVDVSGAMSITLDAGDVLIFNQLLVHGSEETSVRSLRLVYRVSYQGFDQIYVPRGSPIVVAGGGPDSLRRRFPRMRDEVERGSVTRRLINRIGRRLARL